MSKEEPLAYTGLEVITCVFDWRMVPTDRIPAPPAPKKRGPKPTKAQALIISLDTPEERKERQKKRILRENKNQFRPSNFNVPIMSQAESDRTSSIRNSV